MSHSFTRSLIRHAGVALLAAACIGPAAALTLQGPAYITPSTTIPTCGAVCLGVGTNILQIADGDTSDFNGWAGRDGQVGVIVLDLLGDFNLTSFSLWNDINIAREGVGDFRLNFYDSANNFLQSSAIYTAPISQVAAGVYSFASVANVSRVDLEVLSLLTGGACCRIEIREVAFEGVAAVPEPATYALLVAGFGLMGYIGRRRRSR